MLDIDCEHIQYEWSNGLSGTPWYQTELGARGLTITDNLSHDTLVLTGGDITLNGTSILGSIGNNSGSGSSNSEVTTLGGLTDVTISSPQEG